MGSRLTDKNCLLINIIVVHIPKFITALHPSPQALFEEKVFQHVLHAHYTCDHLLRYPRRRNSRVFFHVWEEVKEPEGAKSVKKGRYGNISEPQSTVLLTCARAWSSEQVHIFWCFFLMFLAHSRFRRETIV